MIKVFESAADYCDDELAQFNAEMQQRRVEQHRHHLDAAVAALREAVAIDSLADVEALDAEGGGAARATWQAVAELARAQLAKKEG